MKKVFSILLAVIMLFTSVGMVFADDAPPPVDDQTLPASTSQDVYIYGGAMLFKWAEVVGADKYKVEIQKETSVEGEYKAFKALTVSSKYPIPPTTATVTSKKPFAYGDYRWRVTAVNTDVGIDGAGTSQSTGWDTFSVSSSGNAITNTFIGAFDPKIDPKKFEGTSVASPALNWVIEGGSGLVGDTSVQYVVTVAQGKTKKSYTVTGAACSTLDFSSALCTLPAATIDAMTAGLPYTWEVYGQVKPATPGFDVYVPAFAAVKDTMQYNVFNTTVGVVTETAFTNKPTFKWTNVVVPAKAAFQLVIEKSDLKLGYNVYKWTSAGMVNVVPGVTKNPVTKALACPATGGDCYFTFAVPFKGGFVYRWNVRVLSAGKYGPWANPGTAVDPDDMVQYGTDGDCPFGNCGGYDPYYNLLRPDETCEVGSYQPDIQFCGH